MMGIMRINLRLGVASPLAWNPKETEKRRAFFLSAGTTGPDWSMSYSQSHRLLPLTGQFGALVPFGRGGRRASPQRCIA